MHQACKRMLCMRVKSQKKKTKKKKHRLIGVQQLYPLVCLSQEKSSTPFPLLSGEFVEKTYFCSLMCTSARFENNTAEVANWSASV